MSDRKAVIKNADMGEEMQQDAVDCATQALEKYNIEKVIKVTQQFTSIHPAKLIQQDTEKREKRGKSIRDCFYACTPVISKTISLCAAYSDSFTFASIFSRQFPDFSANNRNILCVFFSLCFKRAVGRFFFAAVKLTYKKQQSMSGREERLKIERGWMRK